MRIGMTFNGRRCLITALMAAAHLHVAQSAPIGRALDRPSVQTSLAGKSVLQGAAKAGDRLLAVGERGIVIVSDDAGKTWRQVPLPVSVGLTAVRFVDERNGWIVGHGGVVLASSDGGQSWTKKLDGVKAAQLLLKDAQAAGDSRALADAQRLVAEGADKPFLDAHFADARNGIVVGAYNLAFATNDGGNTWQPVSRRLDNPRGLHLYSVRTRRSEIVIAGEQGLLLRSNDSGRSFHRVSVPYEGSFFAVELPGAREFVVAGLRGNVWKSIDDGASWTQVKVPVPVSITASALDQQGRLWLGNQAGMVLAEVGNAFVPAATGLPPLTGLLPLQGDEVLALSIAGAATVKLESSK